MNRRTLFGVTLLALIMIVFTAISATRPVHAQVNSWNASYFNNHQLWGRPIAYTVESSINHDWGDNAPPVAPGMPKDRFSARWTGQLNVAQAQEYRITARADDNIRVWVGNELLIDKWEVYAGNNSSAAIYLNAGNHTVKVEYRDLALDAFVHVDIAAASQPTPVPPPTTGGGDTDTGGDCVIPESGPWPPCASGGGGSTTPDTGTGTDTGTDTGNTSPEEILPPNPVISDPPFRVGPLAHYSFNEGGGDKVWDAGSNNLGTINDKVTRIGGPSGGAIRLNNGGTFFAPGITENSISTGDFSIAFWMRTEQNTGVQRIFDKREATPRNIGYHMFVWEGKVGLQLADGQGETERCKHDVLTTQCTNYISNYYIADGNWHYVAVTIDRDAGDGIKLYVDNKLASTMNPTDRQGSLSSGNAVPLVMDAFGSTLDMDDFRLYGRVLEYQEITALFNSR